MDRAGTADLLRFYTAVKNIITEEIDRLRTTAASYGRRSLVETMGRHAGVVGSAWWRMQRGLDHCEYRSIHSIWRKFWRSSCVKDKAEKINYSIIVVAEGAKEHAGK